MKRSGLFTIVFAIIGLLATTAVTAVTAAAQSGDVVKAKIGSDMADVKLVDLSGAEKALKDLKGKNGTVIVFLSAQCPVVKDYNERIQAAATEFGGKGVNFIGINSNATESAEWIKSHAEENYKFPVLIDKGNAFADSLGATVTPELYFYDEKGKLAYRGALDNSRRPAGITAYYLKDALMAALEGKEIAKAETSAFGCSIKRAAKSEQSK
jgi:peroxiredoxin